MKRFLLNIFSLLFTTVISAQVVGKMYSMIYWAGTPPSTNGTINVFDPLDNSDTAVWNFNGTNGLNPYGNFIQLKNGMLYGMVAYGGTHGGALYGGVIYRYDITNGHDTVLYNFNQTGKDANTPYGTLVLASDGKLYGLSYYGGTLGADAGAIFSFDPATNIEKVLDSMKGTTVGLSPTGSLIRAANGLLYGTASASLGGYGSIFSFNINNDTAILLHNFDNIDGNYPRSNLVQDTNGLLYGLTEYGGAGFGVLYSYNIATDTLIDLVDFNVTDGAYPGGTLLLASDGNLYGTTVNGGTKDSGTLFRYNITTNTETVLVNFCDSVGGYYVWSDVIQGSDGRLYGFTELGGLHDSGTIFSYDLSTSTFRILYNLNYATGDRPFGDMLEVMSAGATITNNRCSNDTAGILTIHARGGKPPFTYLWSTGATTSSINNLASGVYTYTVTDSSSTTLIYSDTVKPLPITLHFTTSSPCNGGNTGSAFVCVSGGIAPFTYAWSNGYTTDTSSDLSAGTYTCMITDANGCPGMDTIVIKQADVLNVIGFTITKATYPNYNNGSITVHISGGIPPGDSVYYLYLWSNGGPSEDSLTNLDSGTYAVCITSPYGCGSICDSNIIIATGAGNLNSTGNFVKVYPVPGPGQITIYLGGNGFENLEITDALGRQVFSEPLNPDINNTSLHIDLSNLTEGVYFLHINTQQSVLSGKIIIQKL